MLDEEPAVEDIGAIVVEVFAILFQLVVGIIVFIALCTQRYDKDQPLTMSFSEDMRNSKMSEQTFSTKLLRYARFTLVFQWLSYFVCHVLILSHEFLSTSTIIDHLIYITFIINLTFLFITFRNIGIYYFNPFTDNKSFPNPKQIKDIDDEKREFEDEKDGDVGTQTTNLNNDHKNDSDNDDIDDDDDDDDNVNHNHNDNQHTHKCNAANNDPDLQSDPQPIASGLNSDWDEYNKKRIENRNNMIHLFRCAAFTAVIYWAGYIIAIIYNHNNVVLATLAVADMLLSVLVGCHMYLIKGISDNLIKYSNILSGYDDDIDKKREIKIRKLKRWFKLDIAVLVILFVKFLVMIISITESPTKFSWPESHPVFLATSFVIILTLQTSCCRYVWLTKDN